MTANRTLAVAVLALGFAAASPAAAAPPDSCADKPAGQTVYAYPNGDCVKGVWRAGSWLGPLTIYFHDGGRQVFALVDGKMDGPTVTTYPDGSRLELEYKAGLPTEGRYLAADGQVFTGVFHRPSPLGARGEIPYPDLSRRLNETGTVVCAIFIDSNGTVTLQGLHQSSGSDRLDNAAAVAIAGWRYSPATVGGQPVPFYSQDKIDFSLH